MTTATDRHFFWAGSDMYTGWGQTKTADMQKCRHTDTSYPAAILSFLVCLLLLSIAFVARQKCTARLILKKTKTKKHVNLTTSLLAPSPTKTSAQDKLVCCKCITRTTLSYLCDCLELFTLFPTLRYASQPPDSSYRTFHCWFLRLFCLRSPIYME